MLARWQSGYAEDCKSLYAGSIPTRASNFYNITEFLIFGINSSEIKHKSFKMIKSLVLSDFRNHFSCKIDVKNHSNIVITGPNGAGKTAVLEAVSMLSGNRGMRAADMADIAKFDGSGGFSVFSELEDNTELLVHYNKDDFNRRAKIDSDNAPLSKLAQILSIIWLTPKEDRLFMDSAKQRREFFDRSVTNFNPAHFGRTAKLSKLLSERAGALRLSADNNWLTVLERQIAETSIAIAAARIDYISQLNYFLKISNVSVNGKLESDVLNASASDAEKDYIQYLSQNRELFGDKMVIDGAHKSDFIVNNNLLELPARLTSTGQQKSAIIDIILSHANLIRAKTGKKPTVLLDEVLSHLDLNAVKNVFSELKSADAQVWITGLESHMFKDLDNALFVACKYGGACNIVKQD